VHSSLIAAGQYLYAAVRQVARVAVNSELTRTARRCRPVKNPLYPAAHQTLLAHHARVFVLDAGKGR
jgi:hypothetical protein